MTRRTCGAQGLVVAAHLPCGRALGFTVIALLASLGTGCESAPQDAASLHEQAIVGGKAAPPHAYPWMVELFELYRSKPYSFCGGALIDSTHVLTAAHCSLSTRIDHQQHQFVRAPSSPESVVVAQRPDSLAALGKADFVAVRRVTVHPLNDDETNDYDVAIWELSSPIRLRQYPRLMANQAALDLLSALRVPLRAIGYGARSEEDEGSDVLRQVDLSLVSRARCREAYAEGGPPIPPEEIITDRMLCAGTPNGGKGSCYGDSGSPLFLPTPDKPPLLAGVTSWGAACGSPDYPGVYANVAAVAGYIQACQRGACETRAPKRDCDFDYVDCDGDPANGCEILPGSPSACGPSCDSPACDAGEACLIGTGCAPAKPVVPSARCVVKELNEYNEYIAWFSVNNENEGTVLTPLADQRFTDGATNLISIDAAPPGFIEFATALALDRPDAGTYGILGPDGKLRTASITADTPACPPSQGSEPEQLTLRARKSGLSARASRERAARPSWPARKPH